MHERSFEPSGKNTNTVSKFKNILGILQEKDCLEFFYSYKKA